MLAVWLDGGGDVYSTGADIPLIPASNMKLVTVATALELLGAERDCSAISGAHSGETLEGLAQRILKPSDNSLADALLAALPRTAGRSALTPAQLCAEAWGDRGVYLHGTRWVDGSGLSRRGLMSAEVVVDLLRFMARSPQAGAFKAALPIAGVDGTLRDRMRNGPARARVCAKTGTLTGVSALSGYARTRGGQRLVFAMIMNDFTSDVERIRRIQDQVCSALVTCEREAVCAEREPGH